MGGRLPLGAEFRAIATAEALSVLGDQLAKVALAVLVYQATDSALLTALTYAATFVPDLLAGPLLSPLADRYPRRGVMIASALAQGGLAAALSTRGLPLAVLLVLVAAIGGLAAPFKAAQSALLRSVVAAGQVKSAQVRLGWLREGGQLIGLAAAGGVVALVGTTRALLIDAGTFLLAAGLLVLLVTARPSARNGATGGLALGAGWQALGADRRLWLLGGLIVAGTVAVVPDAVMPAYVAEVGAPRWTIGALMAADVVGYLIGAAIVERLDPRRQSALIGPLAVASVAPLMVFAITPHPVLAAALLALSGASACYLQLAAGEAVEMVDDQVAGSVMGLLRTGLRVGQGLSAAAGGLLADRLGSPSAAVALTATVGAVGATACARAQRVRRARTREAVTE